MTLPSLPVLPAIAIVLVALAWWVWHRRRAPSPRQQAMAALLDAADALEARLRTARDEVAAITGSDDNAVRDALQEMLRQRLWLQQQGATATVEQLVDVRSSIDAARARIDQQLLQIARARAPLH